MAKTNRPMRNIPEQWSMEKRGGALISIDREPLEQRMKDYFDPVLTWEEYGKRHRELTGEQAGFNPEIARKKALMKKEKFQHFANSAICGSTIRNAMVLLYSDQSDMESFSSGALGAVLPGKRVRAFTHETREGSRRCASIFLQISLRRSLAFAGCLLLSLSPRAKRP